MDKYQQMRDIGQRLCQELVGKTPTEAREICRTFGFAIRVLTVNDKSCMITADCRMDRIGCHIVHGEIASTEIG